MRLPAITSNLNMQQHISALTALLDKRSLLVGSEIGEHYHADGTRENHCLPALVIRPEATSAVSKALAYCNEHSLPVVTQGGMTGLSGGATPQQGEIVISLERLNGIIDLDQDSMTMTVRAGTPLQIIQQAAADVGLRFPLDLGARGSCQIGGNVATNAGGNQVVRFGSARALVLGMEAVTADGKVIRAMNQMLKNNAGYDLKHLFIGSEGTLGIITELVLRLYPAAKQQQTALCALSDFASTTAFLRAVQSELPGITAFEVMWSDYLNAVCDFITGLKRPFEQGYPIYVLLESEGSSAEQFETALAKQLESSLIRDAIVTKTGKDTANLWAIRDGVGELLPSIKHFASFDIGLPTSNMQAFIDRTDRILNNKFPGINNLAFGHIADGNLHLVSWTNDKSDIPGIYDCVYEIMATFGGTITAEHGVGVSKRKYLPLCRTHSEIELMKTLKAALDPKGILNRGRIL